MVRDLLTKGTDEVRVLSRDETKQDDMRRAFGDGRLRFFLGDVRDIDSARETQTVPTVTLDSLAEYFPIPDVVKIDVEGAELLVLESGSKVLNNYYSQVGMDRVRGMTPMLKLALRAYRGGRLKRGAGVLFDKTPARIWGGDSVTVPTEAGEMTLPLRDHGARQMLVFGQILHEKAETRLLAALAPRLSRVVDVGANLGWYPSLLVHSGLPADARVIAVEPNPRLAPYLAKNAGRHPQVTVSREAIADQDGEVMFFVAENSGLSSVQRHVGEPHTVPAVTLDSLVDREFGGVAPDFVKLDVEGGELAALDGARGIRTAGRPPMWLIEVDGTFLEEVDASYDEAEKRIREGSVPLLFWNFDRDGQLHELRHLGDLEGSGNVNVFVIPECHQQTFNQAVAALR